MKILYLDCFAGIAGDMFLGALLDAGADFEFVRKGLESLKIDGYTIETGKGTSHGISATYVHIKNTAEQPHRHLHNILEIIEKGELPVDVKNQAVKTFERLAAAEARVHGTTPDRIHFHEVGAIDSICDIIGSLLALHTLGIEKVICSHLPAGSGHTHCAHGIIPVPAPATLELLKGVPIRQTDVEGELVTPTGAALATTLAEDFTTFPDMVVETIGYGMGTKDYGFPNVLRVVMGSSDIKKNDIQGPGEAGDIIVIEANIDDLNPEFYPHIIEKLLKKGSPDAFLTPVIMKGGRPGTLLTALAQSENWPELAMEIFEETSTLGIRLRREHRRVAYRESVVVHTPYGEVSVKIGRMTKDGPVIHAAPEYRECRAAAENAGVSIKKVYNEALKLAVDLK